MVAMAYVTPRKLSNLSPDLPELRIVSFPAYCRCCAMRRRLGGCIGDYVSHPLFGALGGVDPHFRVLFCRDSVPDKELQRLWKCQNYYRGFLISHVAFILIFIKFNNMPFKRMHSAHELIFLADLLSRILVPMKLMPQFKYISIIPLHPTLLLITL